MEKGKIEQCPLENNLSWYFRFPRMFREEFFSSELNSNAIIYKNVITLVVN